MGEVLSKHEIDSLLKALEVKEESMLEIKIKYDKGIYDNAIAACRAILDDGGIISLRGLKEDFGLNIKSQNKRYGLENSVGWNKWSFDPHSEVDENKEYLKLILREPKKLSTLEGYNPGEKLTDKEIKELEACVSSGEVDPETRFHERYEAERNKEAMEETKLIRPEEPETKLNNHPYAFLIKKVDLCSVMESVRRLIGLNGVISIGDILDLIGRDDGVPPQYEYGWTAKEFYQAREIEDLDNPNWIMLELPKPQLIQKQISMVETEDYKALERMNKINEMLVKDPVFGVPPYRCEKVLEKFDPICKPSHYTEGRIYEPRKVIYDWGLDFNLGNAVKYIARAGRKGDAIEDLNKAIQYINFELEELTNKKGDD